MEYAGVRLCKGLLLADISSSSFSDSFSLICSQCPVKRHKWQEENNWEGRDTRWPYCSSKNEEDEVVA